MTIIKTISGKTIDLRYIDTRQLCVMDMAYSLSNIRRFNGHATRNVSVLEHSLMVFDIMRFHLGIKSPAALLAGVMHDAHEYLIGDITQPVKQLMGDAWKAEEYRIQRIVLLHFGVWTAFNAYKPAIHGADMRALSGEREQLMLDDGDVWPCQIYFPTPAWVSYRDGEDHTEGEWRSQFLETYHQLRSEMGTAHQAIPLKS